jgi:hypothetical protein
MFSSHCWSIKAKLETKLTLAPRRRIVQMQTRGALVVDNIAPCVQIARTSDVAHGAGAAAASEAIDGGDALLAGREGGGREGEGECGEEESEGLHDEIWVFEWILLDLGLMEWWWKKKR